MSSELQHLISEIRPIDVRIALFKKRDFDFIVAGYDEDGLKVAHEKQREAFNILTSNLYEEFLWGGAAGGGKTVVGSTWILFMALCYPGTRYFIARNELKDITDSVLVTFFDVCKRYGFSEYKYNSVKGFIQFDNGSHINLIEVKYKPSDPMYEDLGSTEYTAGWIEEVGEINETAATVLSSRVGRYKNNDFKGVNGKPLEGTVLYTCNPKKNWAKREFYDKHMNGTLEPKKAYLQCLLVENPFSPKAYVERMRRMAEKDVALFERLFKGNWEYDDNPYQLADQEMIDCVFNNDHVPEGKRYITADVATFGSDKAVICVWSGWQVIDMITYDLSKTTEIEHAIMFFRNKYKISRNRCIADGDGIGIGVVHGAGIKSFRNNSQPIREGKETPNYRNLQVQCLYLLADKINEGGFWFKHDITDKEKDLIKQELGQIQSKGDQDPTRKLDCKSKADIKMDIGRSPDYRDALMMRVYFDLKKGPLELETTWR